MISLKSDLDIMMEKLYRGEDKIKTNIMKTVDEVVKDDRHGAFALINGVIMDTPSSLKEGKDNRSDTGNMGDKASGFTVMNNEGLPTIYFGWPDAVFNPEANDPSEEGDEYFFVQEFGGDAPDGTWVSPMRALEKVSRDYLAMTSKVGVLNQWAKSTSPRLMPKVMKAIYWGIMGHKV